MSCYRKEGDRRHTKPNRSLPGQLKKCASSNNNRIDHARQRTSERARVRREKQPLQRSRAASVWVTPPLPPKIRINGLNFEVPYDGSMAAHLTRRTRGCRVTPFSLYCALNHRNESWCRAVTSTQSKCHEIKRRNLFGSKRWCNQHLYVGSWLKGNETSSEWRNTAYAIAEDRR